jgi:hypothetical protein
LGVGLTSAGFSAQAVSRWHRRFEAGGTQALRSKGPSDPAPQLSDQQLAEVERALLRHRLGWTVQRPARRAAERDQAAIDRWVKNDWPRIKQPPNSAEPAWSSSTNRLIEVLGELRRFLGGEKATLLWDGCRPTAGSGGSAAPRTWPTRSCATPACRSPDPIDPTLTTIGHTRGRQSTDLRRFSMTGSVIAHVDEIEEANDGRCPWRPVRHHFGITAFGVSTWTGRDAGDRILNEDDQLSREPGHLRAEEIKEDANEQLYLVHRGRARFELADEQVDAPAGTFVFVPPGVRRTAFAEEPGTTIVAIGGIPGKAYVPTGWEVWAPFHPVYESGGYDQVIDRGRELIEATGYPEPLFNLACCESLAGRTADAIRHLRLALERTQRYRERLRSLAAIDTDFDPIRDEPAFQELIDPTS